MEDHIPTTVVVLELEDTPAPAPAKPEGPQYTRAPDGNGHEAALKEKR